MGTDAVTADRGSPDIVRTFGDRAVVVHEPDAARRETLIRELAVLLADATVRGGMDGLLVESTVPTLILRDRVAAALGRVAVVDEGPTNSARVVEIPVVYEGADLPAAAAGLGCSTSDLVSAHQAQGWAVAMMGFAPGFAYLVPVGHPVLEWTALARRASPRAAVPAGSVAVAAGMSAVYPEQMPGGWHLLGRTQVRLFDASADRAPALLAPGDHVRFIGSAS